MGVVPGLEGLKKLIAVKVVQTAGVRTSPRSLWLPPPGIVQTDAALEFIFL